MSFSASVVDAAEDGDPFGILRRQVAWAALGVPAFVLVSAVDHRVWRRLSWVMMAASIVGPAHGAGPRSRPDPRWLDTLDRHRPPGRPARRARQAVRPAVARRRLRAQAPPRRGALRARPPARARPAAARRAGPADHGRARPRDLRGHRHHHRAGPLHRGPADAAVRRSSPVWVPCWPPGLAFTASYRIDRITGWLHPDADPTGYRLPAAAVPVRPRQRRLVRARARVEPRQVELRAQPRDRLRLRDHRRGARPDRGAGRARALRGPAGARPAGRPSRPVRLRPHGRVRHHRLAHRAGHDQHRHGRGPAARSPA